MDRIEHTHFLATFFSLLLLISVVSTGFAPGVGASPDPENSINADKSSALSGGAVSQTEDIDAEIVDITHDSGVHKDGDPVRVTVTVENTGSEANRFYIGFSVRDPSGDWLDGDDEASLYLRPGDKSTTDVIWYVDDDAESGMYDSRVSAWEESDPDNLQNRVADNQKSDAFEVETESKKYQLTADANGDGGFEVYPPGLSTTSVDREYEEGTTVELTATPGPDSQFVDWTGDVDSIDEDDATIEVTMNEAYDITANFEKESQEYRLEADPNGNGGFEVYPPGLSTKSVDRTYEEGTTVELTATPDSDSRFVEWTGDVGSVDEDDATIEVTMDEARDITAEFEKETEVSAEIEDVDPPSGDYTAGEEIVTETTIRNTGNTEHEFYVGYSVRGPDDEWRDNDRSTHESVWVEPGEEETIDVEWEVEDDAPTGEYDIWTSVYRDADGDQLEDRLDESRMMDVFEVETETEEYRLNADTDGEGGLEVDPPGFSTTSVDRNYEEGAEVELTANPGPDNRFVEWSGDLGSADEDDRTIEVTMNEARDITAEFEEETEEYRLNADTDGEGGLEVDPPGFSTTSVDRNYEEGTKVELTAKPGPDSRFVGWNGDVGFADEDDRTIEVTMDEARDITAEFEEASQEYRLEADSDGDGGFELYPPGLSTTSVDRTYEEGTTVELTATPDSDSQFVEWSGDIGSADRDDATIEVSMNEARDITATFEQVSQDYRLEVDSNGEGGFEVYPPGFSATSVDRTYEEGTTVELTATPGPDSRFVEWTGDIGFADENDRTIEVTMDEARDITAEFEEETEEYRLNADTDGEGGFEVNPPGFSTTSVDREYEEGTTVELTATPRPDSRFVEWTGDIGSADSDESIIEVTMSEARDITAVFEPTESNKIDAEIVDVSYDSGVHRVGDPVRTTVTLKNTGSEANRFYVGFDVQNPSGTWLDGDDEASVYLRPGDRTTTDVIWYVDDSAESGMYDARVSAWEESDPENLQTKVADNQQSDGFEVESDNGPPSASRDSPSREITVQPEESVDFSIDAADQNGNLEGAEWYVDDDLEEETQSIRGSSDTAEASFSFDSEGTYIVEGQVFDSERSYGSPVEWEVTVVEKEEIDGALSFVEHPDGSYTKGETVEAEAEITNDGNRENTYYVEYSGIDSSGQEWDNDGATGTTVTLEPGETEFVDVSWEIEDNAPAGEYDSRVALWKEDDPDDLQTRLDENEVYDAFEITEKRSNRISWGEDPPQNINEDESFTISAQGQLNSEGNLCILNENEDSIANTIGCRELSGGEFEESFTIEATDDLTFREGSSTELSFRLENEDGTEDIWTDTRSISLEGTDEVTVRVLEEDGSPVSEADVQLEGVGEKTTNAEGEVTFNSEIDSETRIEVVDGSGHIRESKIINPGEDTVEVEFPNLEPIQGVVLNAERERIEEGITVSIGGTSFEGTTDESGIFEFEHPLPTGDYTLNIEGHEDATLSVEKGVSTYELETYEKTELVKDREKTFVKGAVCGDPCWNSRSYDEEHNLSYLTGWIGASVTPGTGQFADARDLGSALARGSETDAALSALGILSGPAAAPKAAKVTRKFLSRYGKQTQRVGKLVLKSNHIPDSVFHRAVYRGAPDSIKEVDNEILIRYIDEGGDIGPVTRHLDRDVDPNTINKLADEGADLDEIRVGSKVTQTDVDVVKQEVSISEVQMMAKAGNGRDIRYLDDPTWDNHIAPKHINGKEANPEDTLFPTGQSGTPSRMTEKDVKDLIYKGMRQQPDDGRVVMDSSDYPELSEYGIEKMRVIVYDEGNVVTAYPTEGEAVKKSKELSETS